MSIATRQLGAYTNQDIFGGWTRIDLLLQLYDRAIEKLGDAKAAFESGDEAGYVQSFVDSQKTILAIHSGLKPDEHEVAFNIARLLHFVLQCIEKKEFGDAIKVVTELRSGFSAIAEEANALEVSGMIPPMDSVDTYRTTA